jgi:predicted nucleotidyltransferase
VLKQLYSPLIVHTTPDHAELKAICNPGHGDTSPNPFPGPGGEGVITRHQSHHYFGFAETQWKLFEKGRRYERKARP